MDEIRITIDGDQYCALVGPDPMQGRMGCGPTPSDALRNLATEIEIYGWNFKSGIEQKGKVPLFRLRFHPTSTSQIQQLVATNKIAVELDPDPGCQQGSVVVEDKVTGRTLLSLDIERINLDSLAA